MALMIIDVRRYSLVVHCAGQRVLQHGVEGREVCGGGVGANLRQVQLLLVHCVRVGVLACVGVTPSSVVLHV